MYDVVRGRLFVTENFQCLVKMDEDQWMHYSIMFEEIDMNEQKEDEASVKSEHVDCSYAFNTSQVLIWFFFVKVSYWMSLEDYRCLDYILGVCYSWWCFDLDSSCCLWNWFCDNHYEIRHKHWYERKDIICLVKGVVSIGP